MIWRTALAAGLIFAPATTLFAGPPSLSFPLECTLGQDCFIQQYVDKDPSAGARDFTCGSLSYDGHKGTDIRLAHRNQIKGAGVAVHASAAGIVLGSRNSMPDIAQGDAGAPDVSGMECGNGLVIDHGDGWHSQYCHMRQGSVSPSTGQKVNRGDVLGLVGLSGLTQFPHVHIKITHDGQVIDPFNPDAADTCGQSDSQLWETPIPYHPGGLLSAGFADTALSFEAIRQGPQEISSLAANAPALAVWGLFFGLLRGDEVSISMVRPDGFPLFHQAHKIDRNQASAYRLSGKRLTKSRWPRGVYLAKITLTRGAIVLSERNIELSIP